MISAARELSEAIAAGALTSAPSRQVELELGSASLIVDFARARLNELGAHYARLLSGRGLRQWTAADPESQAVRGVAARAGGTMKDFEIWLGCTAPGVVMNAILCLIDETAISLNQQAGVSELSSAGHPIQQDTPILTRASGAVPGAPSCPKCGQPMALRAARKGTRAGRQFWGCSDYPKCTGTRPGN